MAGEFDQARLDTIISLDIEEAQRKLEDLNKSIKKYQGELSKDYSSTIQSAIKSIDSEIAKQQRALKKVKEGGEAYINHQKEITSLTEKRKKIIAEENTSIRRQISDLEEEQRVWGAILEKAQKMYSYVDKSTGKFKEDNETYAAIGRNLDVVTRYLKTAATLTADWDAALNKANITALNLQQSFTGVGEKVQREKLKVQQKRMDQYLNWYQTTGLGYFMDDYNYSQKVKNAENIKQNVGLYNAYADYQRARSNYNMSVTVGNQDLLLQDNAIRQSNILDNAAANVNKEAARQAAGLSKEVMNSVEAYSKLSKRLGVAQLMLRANYAAQNLVIGGFRYLLNYSVQYDAELHQLQAIAAVSDTTLAHLKDTIDAVATSTKFTSLEVVKAGTVLAQAGLSAKQIETTLPAIANLATATGTDLATSTDVITSTLNIYSLQATEATQVTNALTTAMNESKADIAGFQTAIQYAGNFAAQLGVTYEETAAAIAAATQAGIRSKSMLGTGLRAVFTEFLKPSKNLIAQLEKVGLTVSDIDVRTKGFTNVLKTLKEAGFGAVEAFRGMERRGAAFLVSIINQTDFIDDLRSKMAGSTAAIEANETQMKALLNQWKNFVSVAGTAAEKGIGPINKALSDLLKLVNKILSGGTGGVIFSILFGVTAPATVLLTVAALGTSLGKIGSAVITLFNALTKLKSAGDVASSIGWISSLLKMGAWGKITLIVAGLAAIGSAIYYIAKWLGVTTSEWDEWQGKVEESQGKVEEAKESLAGLNSMMERLINQREKLQDQSERDLFVQELLNRYPQAAKVIDKVTMSYEELYEVLLKLQDLDKEKIADAAQVEYETKKEGLPLISEKLGRKLFKEYNLGEKTSRGFFTPPTQESTTYNKILAALSESKNFRDINFDKLYKYSNRADISYGSPTDEQAGRDLIKELTSVVRDDEKTEKEKLNAIAEIRNIAAKLDIPEFEKAINQVSDIMLSEIDYTRKRQQSDVSIIEITNEDLIQKSREKTMEIIDNLDTTVETIKGYSGAVSKKTEQAIDSALAQYDDLTTRLMGMQQIVRDETGAKKDLSKYTVAEAAQYLGTDEQTFSRMLTDRLRQNGLDIDRFEDLSDEEKKARQADIEKATGELLRDNNIRNTFMQMIIGAIDRLSSVIAQTDYGKTQIEQRDPGSHEAASRKAITKMVGAGSVKTIEKHSNKARKENESALVVKLSRLGISPKEMDFSNYEKSRDEIMVKHPELQAKGNPFDVYENAEDVRKETEEKARKGIKPTTTGGNKSGYTFDPKAAEFRKFYSDINIAIKEAKTAYEKANAPLDEDLARWKGNQEYAERVYGRSSTVAEAESIRLKDLEESQLASRTVNMKTYRNALQAQYEKLKGSKDYTDKERYDALKKQYDEALDKKDYKAARTLDKSMRDLEKTHQKVATTEESLTKSISDLDVKIAENNRLLGEGIEKRTVGGEVIGGVGDAMTKYVDSTKQSGLGTLRGSVGYLTSETFNALESSATSMFTSIIDGSKRAGDAFKDFGRSVIETIRDVAIQMAVKQGLTAIMSAFAGSVNPGVTESGGVNSWSYTTTTGHAQGGIVVGPVKNRDSVDMKLMPGEYVLKKSAVDTIGKDYLDSLNNNAAATLSASAVSVDNAKDSGNNNNNGAGGVVNVYVVGQEQQAQMTPQDVVVTITQDMMTGGQTKRLVKSIAMGAI